jgi:hypothetical protein
MTSSARQPVALQSPRLAPLIPPAPPADPGASGRSPYSVREAAALLGESPSTPGGPPVRRHHRATGPPHDDATAPGALKESAMRNTDATGARTGVGRA